MSEDTVVGKTGGGMWPGMTVPCACCGRFVGLRNVPQEAMQQQRPVKQGVGDGTLGISPLNNT